MNLQDIGDFLGRVALQDGRQVGPANVLDWEDLLPPDMRLTDALDVLRAHRRTSTEWLTPAHIIQGVDQIRRARVRDCRTIPEIPADLDQVRERAWTREFWSAVKDAAPDPTAVADHAIGITRAALPPADPQKVAAIARLAASKDIRRAHPAINQETRA